MNATAEYKRLITLLLLLLMGVSSVWAVEEQYDYDGDGVKETYNVVYLNLSSGNNSKAGDTRENAVKDWATAYKKLPTYNGTTDSDRDVAWDRNIIVVCDIQKSGSLFIDENIAKGNGTNGIPVTITGVWPWTAENTTAAKVKTGGGVYLNASNHNSSLASGTTRIGADTKFKYIRFCGQNSFLSMYLHDCMFDVGCVMDDINTDLTTANGAIAGRKAPDLQVFLFANAYNFTVNSSAIPDGGWPQQTKPVTLTIKSGKFGRILSNRIVGTSNDQIKQRYVIGNPDHPLMCVVNVDIDEATTGSAWNTKGFRDDIAFLCAGMTQGAEYCDVEFNIHRGTIATLVGAMQGNSITNTPNVNLSNSSFFGRTKVTLNPENDADVVIQRYFAGCFGRETGGQTGISNAAFYGQSILNMYGGTIESGAYVSAGGISGLKSADGAHHTTDKYIPYVDASANKYYPYMGITYKAYDENMSMPKVTTTLHGSAEVIDLEDTKTEFNIYGGIIKGGLYGGSYGFSPEMPTERTMAGAGSLWGETSVNIYGGTITGGVYGGGMGDPTYYNTAADSRKADFLTVASVYGDTHVNIYGGDISGGIYGGGKGIPYQAQHTEAQTIIGSSTYKNYTCPENEFLNIAKVYGSTNITIDPRMPNDFETSNPSWTFTGNIYGGGALGAVEGNTKVIIKGGNITGNVFGAGDGENGHPNKAKVGGTSNTVTVNVENSNISDNVYGGGNLAVAEVAPTINVNGGTISKNVYGGGYGASAVLTGNPTINVNGGTIAQDVYGGGALANVTGSTEVNVNGGTVTHDVYGGGALANVTGSTSVNLTGGTIRNSYGGGLGSAEVAALTGGDATTTLNGSIVLGNIFGCNNLNGTPQGHALVDIKATTAKGTETQEHPYHVTAVYGGGNQAAYVPANDTEKAEVLVEHCDNSIEDVFGGGNAAAVPETDVTIWGGMLGRVFAGGNGESAPANVTRDTHVMIHGGTIGEVYGGSNNSGDIGGTIHVDVAELKYLENNLCPINVDDLYGGGNLAAGNAGHINIGKCTRIGRVFGGAHNANVNGDITLAINDGHINNVFGGNNEGGQVNGNITLNIDWNDDADASLGNVYGGGNIASIDNGTPREITVNLLDATTTGSVFGGGKGKTAYVVGNTHVNIGDWDQNHRAEVTGNVFGGGDLAAVEGNCNVFVRDCGTIIHGDLYGGGNAAPAFETNTTMWGGAVMGNLFGGGNGVNLDPETGNPKGAQVGYTHDDTESGGSGNANTYLYGGTIGVWNGDACTAGGSVFGGSNSNGNIREKINLLLDERACPEDGAGQCLLKLKEVYGAGNEAAYAGEGIDLTLGYVSFLGEIYGGAKAADLNTNAVLNITSGHFGRVFGGNNMSGKLKGSITVNIDETGCYPVVIDELYGGGNLAPYSVYGYEDALDAEGKAVVKTGGTKLYDDPLVNIISCTHIGTVYGGGFGASAVMVGNPTVTINQIKGIHAGTTPPGGEPIPDALGTIGTIFGGGNAAKVVGNTHTNIGTQTQNAHFTGDTTPTTAGANISGNIYGGGNQADVTGKTHVVIGH